jgi:transposase-like protein
MRRLKKGGGDVPPRHRLTSERKRRFLEALREGATVAAAARAAGVSRMTAYRERARNPDFAAAWDDAIEDGTDELEEEVPRRALDGNDRLLMFPLEARRPEKYRDRRHVRHDAPARVEVVVSLPEPEDAAPR